MTVAQAAASYRRTSARAKVDRDHLHTVIREHAANGTSKTLLAEQSGLSRQTIHNILKEER